MRKTLLWIVTATLLLSGCGSSTEHAAVSAQPQEETTKAVEETAEASTETEAEDDLTSKFLPKDEVDEILEKAEVTKNELVTLVSSSRLAEDDRYHTTHLVNYVYDIYSFTIPFTWLGFDDNEEIWIEDDQDHGAMVSISSTDLSEYGTVLTEENAEKLLQNYESKDADYYADAFELNEMEISSFKRFNTLGDQKASATSYKGKKLGLKIEGILVVAVDIVNNRLILIQLVQTLNCEKSHFDDFKIFLGTMTY